MGTTQTGYQTSGGTGTGTGTGTGMTGSGEHVQSIVLHQPYTVS